MNPFLEWQYLIFELPALAAVLFVLLMGYGGLDFGETDVDLDVDLEHDGHVDHDVDLVDSGLMSRALSVLGVGKVPVSIIIMTFCLIWGFTGFFSNRILEGILPLPIIYGPISMGVAFFAAMFMTGAVSGVMSKLMPKTETYATTPADLVGKRGVVLYTVSQTAGTIRVRDAYRNLLNLSARSTSEDVFGPDEKVVIIGYNDAEKTYQVGKDNLDLVVQ